MILPIPGSLESSFCVPRLTRMYHGWMRTVVRYRGNAPTFLEIDILLSLRITMKFLLKRPALLTASKASPPVKEPSPMTAMVWLLSPLSSLALAMPNAAEMDVLLWPVLKSS